jgi:mannan endo-1,4-beta-mannosidase
MSLNVIQFAVVLCVLSGLAFGQATLLSPPPTPCEPVNPNATAEARALLKTICSVSGKNILSGQKTAANLGKYPYVWGSDFGFTGGADKDSIEGRDAMIEEAKKQYAAGSIITLMWHAVRPLEDEPVQPGAGWKGSVQAKLTDDQWAALTTPGTELNRRWLQQIDVVAKHLKRLQEVKIPVLWRPYHENNGDWFWWGGRKGERGFAALYRMMFDRYVNYHRLDNLIWVWNANAPNGKNAGPYYDYFPGLQYADILATDVYGEFKQSHHDELVTLAAGKPVALGEIGAPPPLEALKTQTRYAWFMGWSDIFDRRATDAHKALFADPRTLSRGDALPEARR